MALFILSACMPPDKSVSFLGILSLYGTGVEPGLLISINNPEEIKLVTPNVTQLTDKTLRATTADLAAEGKAGRALTLAFNNACKRSLQISSQQALNLFPYM